MKQKHQSRRLAQILKELLVVSLLFNFQFSIFNSAWAQMKGGVPVKVSNKTQMVNGKRYFVHVVDQGQTVYAISRAYGLKEVEAITKKDIHFLQIGDTVWLPCKGQRLPDGTVAPPATGSAEPATDAGMRSGQATSQQHTAVNTDVRQQQAERREPAQPETPLGPTAEIRQRVNPQSVVVSLMMPFNLSQMDKISTSKFDVEQRGKTVYKSLEFIQFYEGLLLGLEQLEKMEAEGGFKTVLLFSLHIDGTLLTESFTDAAKNNRLADADYMIGQTMDDIMPMNKAIDAFCHLRDSLNHRPAYQYLFARKLPGTKDGAFHSAELWYVFNTLGRSWRPMTPADHQLAEKMVDYWTNFAKYGNPNGNGRETWHPFTLANPFVETLNIE